MTQFNEEQFFKLEVDNKHRSEFLLWMAQIVVEDLKSFDVKVKHNLTLSRE